MNKEVQNPIINWRKFEKTKSIRIPPNKYPIFNDEFGLKNLNEKYS
ncbi:MAG: hypothetical protein HYU67_04985 [Flavobacteriia bacterium]|nr:hypothetical protein [Flavobacteriia bacterium]